MNPKPYAPNQTATICSGGSFTISPIDAPPTTIVPAGTTYTWLAPTGSNFTGGATGTNQPSISGTLTNTTNTTQTAIYTVTPTAGTCSGGSFTITVTINPKPVIPNQTAAICIGNTFSLSPVNNQPITIVPVGTTYTWPDPVVTGGVSGGASGSNQTSISGNLSNPTNVVQTATYTITPTSGAAGNCVGATFTLVVTLSPIPQITDVTTTVCSGGIFTISPVNSPPAVIVPAGTTYSWSAPVVTGGLTGGVLGANLASITGTLTNPTNTPQTATYTVTPSSGGCPGASFTIIVTVNPKPVIPNQTAAICSGGTFTISPANAQPTTIVPTGTTYTWSTPGITGGITGGAPGVSQTSITGTLINPTNTVQTATYTVTPTSGATGNCPGNSFTVIVTVNPTPVIPAQTATICSGTSFSVTPANGQPTVIVPSGTLYTWAPPVVTGSLTGGTSGTSQASITGTLVNTTSTSQTATYTITPTAGTCTGNTFTVTVTIDPLPIADAGIDQTINYGISTSLTGSANAGTPGYTYVWLPVSYIQMPNTTATINTQLLTNNPSTFTLTVTDSKGCISTDQVDVLLNGSALVVDINATPQVICNTGAVVQLGATASGGNSTSQISYTWTSVPAGFTSSLQNPTATPITTTTYYVSVNDGFNTATNSITVTVNPLPMLYNVTGGGEYCSGGVGKPVGLSNSQTGVNYQLLLNGVNTGLPITGTNSAITFGNQTAAGTYTVHAEKIVTNCEQDMTGNVVIAINPLPIADAGIDKTINYGISTTLTGSATAGTPGYSYLWAPVVYIQGSPASAIITTQLLTVNPSTFSLTVTDSKGCISTDQVDVLLNGSALAVDISATPQVICNTGAVVQLGATASGGNSTSQISYTWTSVPAGFTSSLQNPTATPITTTTYYVSVNDGFNTATNSITVTVNPLPMLYNVTGGGEYCSGGVGKPVGLSNSQTGVNYQLLLNGVNTGLPITGTNSAITFGNQTAAGTYTVHAEKIVTNCEQDMTGNVVIAINPLPIADAGIDKTINYGISTTLTGSATAGTPGYLYLWAPVVYIQGSPATAIITTQLLTVNPSAFSLTVTDSKGCVSTDQVDVILNGSALAVTASANPQEICNNGAAVQLDAAATGGNSSVISNWAWSVSGVPFSTTKNPIVNPTVTTTYAVTVNDGYNTAGPAMVTVTVHPLPLPQVINGGGVYCAGDPGLLVGLNGTETGVSYQLLKGIIAMGSPVTGTGSSISFGLQTLAGTYTVVATNATTNCTNIMTGSVNIAINPLPTLFGVTGGGNYPAGGTGVMIGLSGSQAGISYQLFVNGVSTGIPVAGTGVAISFGLQTVAGNYTVVGTNTTTFCFVIMTGSATVVINPLPLVFDVTGGGDRCFGSAGLPVGLNGSEVGIDYQLLFNALPIGALVHGTGFALNFGLFITAGVYTVQGINAYTLAPNMMNGNAVIIEHPLPSVFIIIPPGSHCSGSSLGMNGSQAGINYILLLNGSISVATLPGTGSVLDFGPQIADGTYSIRAEDAITLCPINMTGVSIITPLPLIYNVTPAGNNCITANLGLDGSQAGVRYELFKNGIATGITRIGNGNPVTFGIQTVGTYTVSAVILTTGCLNSMAGSILVSPAPISDAGADASICAIDSFTLNAQATHYSNYIWSTPGDGWFDDPTVLNTVYHPGVNDTTNHSVFLTFTVNGIAGCIGTSTSDQVKLSFDPMPVAIAGADDQTCAISMYSLNGYARNYSSISWFTSGNGHFSGSGSLMPVYTPGPGDASAGQATLTIVAQGTKSCVAKSSSDNLILTIDPLPQVEAGLNRFNCMDNPALLDGTALHTASVIWSTDGDGTFNDNLIANAIYTPGLTDLINGSVELLLQGTGTATCTDIIVYDSVRLTIMELPTAFASYTQPNCANEVIHFTDLSFTLYGNVSKWIWNYGDGSLNDTINFPDEPNMDHHYNISGTYFVTLYITNSFGCQDTYNFPVTVIPNPIANYYFDGNCDEQIVYFQDASSANGPGNLEAWHWDFGDPASGINNTSVLKDPQHVFYDYGTYSVSLIATNYNNCSDTMTKLVTINALPDVDFTHSQVCLNSAAYFIPDPAIVNIPNIITWHWDFGDGLTSVERNTIHLFDTPGSYQVTLTVTDSVGCSNSISHTIIVNMLPIAHFDAGTNNCSGTEVTFADLSNSPSNYIVRWIWDFGDGNTQTVLHPGNPTVTHSYVLAGTYPVVLTVQSSDSCWSNEQQLIVIKPGAVANFVYSSAPCSNAAVLFTDLTQFNGGGSIVLWSWNFGDPAAGSSNYSSIQNPEHQFTASGQYNVVLQISLANGCNSEFSKIIDVSPSMPVDFLIDYRCEEYPAQFQPDASVVNISDVTAWYWDFGDGFISQLQTPQHQYANSGNYQVTFTITDVAGCSSSITKTIGIIPKPISSFVVSTPTCSQAAAQFTDLSSAPFGYIMKWQWDFGDGTIQNITFPSIPDVSHIYADYGIYTVTLKVTTGDSCTNTVSKPVTVMPNPLANYSYGTVCRNETVQFSDMSQSGSGELIAWVWDFGDPASGSNNTSTLQNAIHLFTFAGNYTVRLIAMNNGGCSDTIAKLLTIHELPAVDFSTVAGCENDSTQFISTGFVNANATVSRIWDFGDGFTSPEIDPYHVYQAYGTYEVTLSVTDTAGCMNTRLNTVAIMPPPNALFEVTSIPCANNPVVFNDLSTSYNGQFNSWYWDFGDGADTLIYSPSNPDISHSFLLAGTYLVKLKATTSQGCENEFTQSITISASPLAEFGFSNTCASSVVDFTNQSTSNGGTSVMGYLWNFGDPGSGISNTSTLADPPHIYNTAGSYVVILQVSNATGCPDTVSHILTISPKPAVNFSWANTCIGTITNFTVDAVVTNIPDVQVYDWDFGDGTSHSAQQDPSHAYSIAGNYSVTLSITDITGCTNSITYPIVINAQPTAMFGSSSGCVNSSTQFIDESFVTNGNFITGWNWDFGISASTNDTSSRQNPSWIYTYPGTYTVSLIATSEFGCEDTLQKSILVAPLPSADFKYTAAPCHNGAVYFQDSSFSQTAAIVEWYWLFLPGQYSTLKDPVFVFPATDSCYTVKLVVKNADGCTDTITKPVCVPASFQFNYEYTPTCLGFPMEFSPQMLNPVNDSLLFFEWNFGEPSSGILNSSAIRNPAHTYSEAGTYLVSLTAFDLYNCSATKYKYVYVSAIPDPAFSYDGGICDSLIVFSNLTNTQGVDLQQLVWDFGEGMPETFNAPFNTQIGHIYPIIGAYAVTLTSKNINGCEASVTDTVRHFPCMYPKFNAIDTLLCQNYSLAFSDSSLCGGTINTWKWDFGDGTISTYNSYTNPITHTYLLPGSYTVKLIISTLIADKSACDSITTSVLIQPGPTAGFTTGKSCMEYEVQFNNITNTNSLPITSYYWTFNDSSSLSDTSTSKNPSYIYVNPGLYNVNLIAVNTAGCQDTISKTLRVHQLPEANFENSLSCAGYKTNFINLSDSIEAPVVISNWIFNGTKGMLGWSDKLNPSFVFDNPGVYLVQLQVADTNGCIDTISKQIEAWENPTSSFIYAENFNDVQGQLSFDNISFNAVKYFWDFGNGETSYAEKPVELFSNDGKYRISLITWNDKGCSDTLSAEYNFLVKGLFVPNAFSPNNPHKEVQIFKPAGINLEEYRIEVYDRWGNLIWWSDKLDKAGRPVEGWDGTYNGIDSQQGNYIWKAHAVFKDGEIWGGDSIGNTDNLSGDKYGKLTLIR